MLQKAREFMKDWKKRTDLVNGQIRALSSCTDETQKKLLEYWISNNRRWLLENETKYTIYIEIINAFEDGNPC